MQHHKMIYRIFLLFFVFIIIYQKCHHNAIRFFTFNTVSKVEQRLLISCHRLYPSTFSQIVTGKKNAKIFALQTVNSRISRNLLTHFTLKIFHFFFRLYQRSISSTFNEIPTHFWIQKKNSAAAEASILYLK